MNLEIVLSSTGLCLRLDLSDLVNIEPGTGTIGQRWATFEALSSIPSAENQENKINKKLGTRTASHRQRSQAVIKDSGHRQWSQAVTGSRHR